MLYPQDSSDDTDMSHFAMRFVQGSPQDGDATLFMKAFLRHIRASRMSDWSLKKQAFACAAACDDVTEAAIETAIELGHFTIGARAFNFERGVVVVGGVDAAADAAAIQAADDLVKSMGR